MKNVVITIALLMLCSFILLYQLDANLMERETYRVKAACDRMASAASLCLDEEMYARGMIVFSCDAANSAALKILGDNLGYDAGYFPVNNGYFDDRAVLDTYYFDDSLNARHYINGAYSESFEFLYGKDAGLYVPEYSESGIVIQKPCVICVLDCGRPNVRAAIAPDSLRIVRKSIYEYR